MVAGANPPEAVLRKVPVSEKPQEVIVHHHKCPVDLIDNDSDVMSHFCRFFFVGNWMFRCVSYQDQFSLRTFAVAIPKTKPAEGQCISGIYLFVIQSLNRLFFFFFLQNGTCSNKLSFKILKFA